MDRHKQRFKKRTAVTKEQALNFLCANEAAEQNREAHQCGKRNSNGITRPCGAAAPALFGSTPDQDPKAAKFAVLIPGRAGFPNRAKRSEGSDSAPTRNAPCFAV